MTKSRMEIDYEQRRCKKELWQLQLPLLDTYYGQILSDWMQHLLSMFLFDINAALLLSKTFWGLRICIIVCMSSQNSSRKTLSCPKAMMALCWQEEISWWLPGRCSIRFPRHRIMSACYWDDERHVAAGIEFNWMWMCSMCRVSRIWCACSL